MNPSFKETHTITSLSLLNHLFTKHLSVQSFPSYIYISSPESTTQPSPGWIQGRQFNSDCPPCPSSILYTVNHQILNAPKTWNRRLCNLSNPTSRTALSGQTERSLKVSLLGSIRVVTLGQLKNI